MIAPQIEIQLIASLVAVACAIPGVFLVLRKMALISDAISHSILLGIVLGFFITQDLSSPLLIIMAGLIGVVTVILVEAIQNTKLVKEDTAIGLVFPALFSIGIILIAQNAGDVHLDLDAVLLGELAFAPFNRLYWGEMDLGPKALWVTGTILLITLALLITFFKELKVSTFDPGLAAALGISPVVMHYALMSISSITIVGAFDAVGAVLVVALIIVPAATAYLLTTELKKMLWLSIFFGLFSALSGYWTAHALDASIAGSMASMLGFIFLIVYLFAPGKGYFANSYKERRQRKEVMLVTLLLHLHTLKDHNNIEERRIAHLYNHFKWTRKESDAILKLAEQNGLIEFKKNNVYLTEKGENFGHHAIDYILSNKVHRIERMKKKFWLFRG